MTEGVDQTEGYERRRLLPGLLRQLRNLGQRRRRGRHDEHARCAGARHDDQERRQRIQGTLQPDRRGPRISSINNVDAATAARGFDWSARTSCSGNRTAISADRWCATNSGSSDRRNHFHIDKVISGVPEQVATDLGIVDDMTTKETWKPGANDTVSGYYQHQHKQQPKAQASP